MTAQHKQFDTAALDKAFKAALAHPDNHVATPADLHAMGLHAGGSIQDAEQTFCAAWPKVRPFLNLAINAIGWFQPGLATMAKAAIAAIDAQLIPLVCGAK